MYQLIMPKMGESVAEATVLKWLKQPGDRIEMDEPVLEIATDKVDSEIPSPAAGVLSKKMFEEGQVVKIGQVVALIDDGKGEAVAEKAETAKIEAKATPLAQQEMKAAPVMSTAPSHSAEQKTSDKFFSPLVLNIARQESVSMSELDGIKGSGMNDRVTKQDLLKYIEQRKTGKPADIQPARQEIKYEPAIASNGAPTPQRSEGSEIIEMDRMRKLIAEHMVMSKHTAPHVTSFVEADVTRIVKWREKIKSAYEKKEGEKLTFTPIFIEAIIKAIKDFPMINVSLDGTKIIVKKDINIGMAAALPSGNLIVPVIKNADRLSLSGLVKSVNDLANRARQNKLQPDDIQGGTYTLTNVGTFGNVMGTPIINQPQVAIMATGAIRKKPAVIETEEGDVIGIRHMMFLSHSYDHRIVDGALGGSFVRRVADYLEQFDMNRQI